uniref:Calponin homolog OV9M n=1 Tax=Panagrellus redivivus TaxID=6233 RepID=A0A7E4WDX2_PANRE
MSTMFHEQREHYYNRSYVTVNADPSDADKYSPFPYSHYSAVPRYSSRLDDYASRFSTSKLSPGMGSDDGYGSSSASSTFTAWKPKREASFEVPIRAESRLSAKKDGEDRPVAALRTSKPSDGSPVPKKKVSIVTPAEFGSVYPAKTGTDYKPTASKLEESRSNGLPASQAAKEDIDGKPQKNVKHTIAEIEQRDTLERQAAEAATMPELTDRFPKPLPEEKIRLSDGIVRLQSGTNKYDSQKGMTGFGTSRRETTKMVDSKHPEYDHERPDQSEIPLQSGTNKFASQKGMTGFGTNRRETAKIVDTAHPEYDPETSIDATSIPYQMGSNLYASQKGMTGFGQPRWEVLDPSISWQNRKSQGMVRLQSGTNRFASQSGMIGFGTIRNTTYLAENGDLPYEDMKKSEAIIPSQAGWNRGDSQKKMTSFGAPRDTCGKHLKRIWELEYPEEAQPSLDRL